MSNDKYTLNHTYLIELLDYNPSTGRFTRKTRTRGTSVGAIAGGKEPDGYIRIRLSPYKYPAHILAWFYHHGEWPAKHIDHIDGNRANNSIDNLRLADQAENTQNLKTARKHSKTGLLGVSTQRNGYIASIKRNGINHYLGFFKDPNDAHKEYIRAKRVMHPFSTL